MWLDLKTGWATLTVKLQALWAAAMSVFVLMPADTQVQLISLLGFDGKAVLSAFTFFAQVNIAYAAATVAARMKTQAGLPK